MAVSILHSHQQCIKVPGTPYLPQHLVSSGVFVVLFLILAILIVNIVSHSLIVSHCSFNSHFPNDKCYWTPFHMLIYLSYIYLLWWCICSDFLLIFKIGVCIFLLSFEDFIYSEYKPFVGYVIFKYFLQVSGFFFPHFIKKILALQFNRCSNTNEYFIYLLADEEVSEHKIMKETKNLKSS